MDRRILTRVALGLLALVAACVALLAFDQQRYNFHQVVKEIDAHIAESEKMLEHARQLAPDGDADSVALQGALGDARRRLALVAAAFLDPQTADYVVSQRFAEAGLGAAEVAAIARVPFPQEFEERRRYEVPFVSVDEARAVAGQFRRRPWLHHWQQLRPAPLAGQPERVLATFDVFLMEADAPGLDHTLPACAVEVDSRVWLPPYSLRVRERAEAARALCAAGAQHAETTRRVVELHHLRNRTQAQRIVRDLFARESRRIDPLLPRAAPASPQARG
jgi:hypothetical protein